jgi:hypothetical protein
MLEKRQALQKWVKHLGSLKASKQAEVLPIGAKRRQRAEEQSSAG